MTYEWTAPDGEKFSGEEWETQGPPRGVLVCVHGLGGAASDFRTLAAAMAGRGFFCCAPNLRGQGLDSRPAHRGAFFDVPVIVRDLAAFARATAARFPGRPVFLCGESMGALLVARLLAEEMPGVRGAIFSAPVTELREPTPAPVRLMVRLLAAVAPGLRFFPSWFVSGKTKPLRMTRDEAHADAVMASPHYIRAFTFRALNSLGNLMESRDALAAGVRVPALVLAAGQDAYILPRQVRAWFDSLPSRDKTFRLYPTAYHLLWNDWDRELVMADILAWLDARAECVSI